MSASQAVLISRNTRPFARIDIGMKKKVKSASFVKDPTNVLFKQGNERNRSKNYLLNTEIVKFGCRNSAEEEKNHKDEAIFEARELLVRIRTEPSKHLAEKLL